MDVIYKVHQWALAMASPSPGCEGGHPNLRAVMWGHKAQRQGCHVTDIWRHLPGAWDTSHVDKLWHVPSHIPASPPINCEPGCLNRLRFGVCHTLRGRRWWKLRALRLASSGFSLVILAAMTWPRAMGGLEGVSKEMGVTPHGDSP